MKKEFDSGLHSYREDSYSNGGLDSIQETIMLHYSVRFLFSKYILKLIFNEIITAFNIFSVYIVSNTLVMIFEIISYTYSRKLITYYVSL